jgi:uncharacterized protein (TIGR00730 family)
MGQMKRVCVFCGSNSGSQRAYQEAAQATGAALARRGIGLVYGGGRVGLMGFVADAVLREGGEVIGVIPEALVAKEAAHRGLTELRVVGSMHERKCQRPPYSEPPGSGKLSHPGSAILSQQGHPY